MSDITVRATIDSTGALVGARSFNGALGTMRTGVAGAGRAIGGLTSSIFSLQGALAGLGGAFAIREAIQAGDAYTNLKARLTLFAAEGQSAQGILEGLNEAAARANAPVSSLADVYNRNAGALQVMGKSTADGIRLSETLYKALAVSGNVTESGRAALMQFAQSLNSGVFRGEEFNSVNEQATEIIRILARETGKTAGELRKMANEGQLTSDVVFNALLNGAADLDEKFKQLPITVSQAGTRFTDTFSQVVGASMEVSGANRSFASAIQEWTKVISSGEFGGWLGSFANGLKTIADYAGAAAKELRIMAVQSELRAQESDDSWFGSVKKWFSDQSAKAAAKNAEIYAALNARNPEFATNQQSRALAENIVSWQDGTTVRTGDSVSATPTNAPDRAIEFAAAVDKEAVKRAERVTAEASKQIELEKLRGDLTRAQIAGDDGLAQTIRTQLEVRQRISDEMRTTAPEKAASLANEIYLQNALEITLKNNAEIQKRNTQFAQDFASTITDSFGAAIRGGESFGQTLKSLALDLLDVITKAALLDPLQKQLSGGVGNFFKSSGFDIGNLFGFAGGDAGLGSWAPTIGFADGGVVNRSTRFSDGGRDSVMGEAGPEAILPLARGSDGKLGVRSSGAGAAPTIVNITVMGDATDATIERMRQVAQQEFQKGAPGIVSRSVQEVAKENRANSQYLRR